MQPVNITIQQKPLEPQIKRFDELDSGTAFRFGVSVYIKIDSAQKSINAMYLGSDSSNDITPIAGDIGGCHFASYEKVIVSGITVDINVTIS